ncbi:MAG TPA: class I SAM-dependent methyltransferase [Burkholderiales bacterium]|nr:class I SAM-dependent methyltransferase [Burkholderiales bacterium]
MVHPLPPDLTPSPDAVAHSRRLVELIAVEIEKARGWIGFDRYMELCLYAPGLGYYDAGATKFGGAGDFATAPEISSLFGRTLARQVAEVLATTGGDVLELGAGSGRLAADLLKRLDELGQLPERYRILEVSADLAARQKQQLQSLNADMAARVVWIDRIPASFRGVIVANEVLDAVPVHLVVWRDDGVYERGVTWRDGGFAWNDRLSGDSPLLLEAQRLGPRPPYLSEINLAAPALMRALAASLERGAVLLVDYGFGEREYYHPQRDHGTLMCHYRHHAHDDPFFAPGLQDVTSHVDFTAIARTAHRGGLDFLGYTTQAQFLINLGIIDLMAGTRPENAADYLPLAAQAQKLLSPAEMGELFKVIALGRGIRTPLTGFGSGDKSRLL